MIVSGFKYRTIMLKRGSIDRHIEDSYSIQDSIDGMQMKTIKSSRQFSFMIKVTWIGTFAILFVFGFVHAAQDQVIIKILLLYLVFY